jgi:hypothetical protein
MNLITYRALRTFLNAQVLPDQYGGQSPEIKIVDGNIKPHIAFEKRDSKKDKRVLIVGDAWLFVEAICDLKQLKEKL